MISNTFVLKFLRKILIDRLAEISGNFVEFKDIPVFYTNKVISENKKGLYIVEQFLPVSETPEFNLGNSGSGVYRFLIYDDRDKGLRIFDLADLLVSGFHYGVYVVDNIINQTFEEMIGYEKCELVIDDIEVNGLITQRNEPKVFLPLSIYYRKCE